MKDEEYLLIAKKIDPNYMVYRDEDYINFLYPFPPKNSNILLQESSDGLIVWSIDYREKPYSEVLSIIRDNVSQNLIVPFLETEEEYHVVIGMGGEQFDFHAEDCEDYSREFGSFIIRKL